MTLFSGLVFIFTPRKSFPLLLSLFGNRVRENISWFAGKWIKHKVKVETTSVQPFTDVQSDIKENLLEFFFVYRIFWVFLWFSDSEFNQRLGKGFRSEKHLNYQPLFLEMKMLIEVWVNGARDSSLHLDLFNHLITKMEFHNLLSIVIYCSRFDFFSNFWIIEEEKSLKNITSIFLMSSVIQSLVQIEAKLN